MVGSETAAPAPAALEFHDNGFLIYCRIQVDKTSPTIGIRNGGRIADFAPFVIHFEEEEVGKLLDVIAVGKAIVTQDGAVVRRGAVRWQMIVT